MTYKVGDTVRHKGNTKLFWYGKLIQEGALFRISAIRENPRRNEKWIYLKNGDGLFGAFAEADFLDSYEVVEEARGA